MDWRIGQHTFSAPGASWCTKLIFLTLVSASAAWGQAPVPSNVRDCRPCTFSPGAKIPTYSFTFELKTAGRERSVQAIEVVNQSSKTAQRLPVTGMEPVGQEDDFFFGGVDINFDGLSDLMLITRRGVANAYAAYWLFDPKASAFTSFGTYPVFRVDSSKKRLMSYERGGSAGMIYESKEFAFVDGKLTLMREEKQDATKQPGVFRKVVRERAGGVMKVVKTETVQAQK